MNSLAPDLTVLWPQVLERMAGAIGLEQVELWLKPVGVPRLEGGVLWIKVPNRFFAAGIRGHVHAQLLVVVGELLGTAIGIDYEVSREFKNSAPLERPAAIPAPQAALSVNGFNPRYTFAEFVIGDSNRLACATAESIAKAPGTHYNPCFLYGGAGLGKTHLLHAVGNAMRQANPRARVLYTTGESFVNEFIAMIQQRSGEFRAKYRGVDCLLIDDIQFFIGKERSQEEFFHTFNSLFETKKQLVIASDRSPSEMAPSEQRMITRLQSGVVAEVKPPDSGTRLAIVRKKAETAGLRLSDEVLAFVASSMKNNVRLLEGALITLKAFSSATGAAVTVESAKDILRDSLSDDDTRPANLETIQLVVARKYSVDVKDLKSQNKTNAVVLPRQVAMYLCREMTDLSSKEVGAAFGGRDHSTVLHAHQKIKTQVDADPFLVELVNKLRADIRAIDGQRA
jgi:chromosomal replication initiator protein